MRSDAPSLERLVEIFANRSWQIEGDRLMAALYGAVSRRPDLLEPLRHARVKFNIGFWQTAVQYVVPEFRTSITAAFDDDWRTNEMFGPRPDSFADQVVELLTERRSEYGRVLATKYMQFNVPERVDLLEPAAAPLMRKLGIRVFVEVGTAAGLVISEFRHRHSGVVVAGSDIDPQRLNEPDSLRWIRAHFESLSPTGDVPLQTAEALERNLRDPPLLVRGSGVEGARAAIHELEHRGDIAPGEPLVLFHAFAAASMTPEEQAELYAFPRGVEARQVYRVSIEVPDRVADVSPIGLVDPRHVVPGNAFVMVHAPDGSYEVVATGTSYGRNIEHIGDGGGRGAEPR